MTETQRRAWPPLQGPHDRERQEQDEERFRMELFEVPLFQGGFQVVRARQSRRHPRGEHARKRQVDCRRPPPRNLRPIVEIYRPVGHDQG